MPEVPSQKCPSCGKGLRIPASAAGKMVRCPVCQAPITVPASVATTVPLPASPKTPAKSPPVKSFRKAKQPGLPPVELKKDESGLEFEGFSAPIAAYRVESARVSGAGCMMVVLVVMSVLFAGIPFLLMDDGKTKNVWLLFLICVGFSIGWLVMTVWMGMRLSTGRHQRVLLYPEGVVIWRDGKPVPYLWAEIASVSSKSEDPGPQNRGLVRLAMVGKDFEVTVQFEGDNSVKLTALLLGLPGLFLRMKEGIASPPEPDEGEPEAPPTGANAGDPFGNLF